MAGLMDMFNAFQNAFGGNWNTGASAAPQTPTVQTDWGSRDMSNLDNAPTDAAGMASWQDYQAKNNSPTQSSVWNLSNLGTPSAEAAKAPTYSAAGLTNQEGGRVGYSGNDPALLATLTAGNQGALTYGVNAFGVGNGWNSLNQLAQQTGFDASGYGTAKDLRYALDDYLKDYYAIGGLSQGWNDTGDVRGATGSLYKRVDGQLVPLQTKDYHAREEGGWLQEHPGILAPIAVATGGLAYGAMGAGAGAGAGAAGTAGTGTAAGTTAASGGLSGSLANAVGLGSQWASLPAWGQGAISNALMGGVSSGVRGGNILEGALMGGLTGGVGGGITSGLAGAGMNSALAGGLGRLGGSLVGGAVQGGDLGSILQNSALSAGAGALGNQLGFNAPITDNSLGAILARMAAQQGGSYLAGRIDPRLAGLGSAGLASLYNRYS